MTSRRRGNIVRGDRVADPSVGYVIAAHSAICGHPIRSARDALGDSRRWPAGRARRRGGGVELSPHGTTRAGGTTFTPSANVAVSRYSSFVLGSALDASENSVS